MQSRFWALLVLTALTPLAAQAQSALPAPIETQELHQLDAWTVSALARSDGALPGDLWNRSDPAFIGALFDRLPAAYDSPAAQNLARRVLFSGGDAPSGDAAAAAQKRFEAIGRMGAADELSIMAGGAGSSLNDVVIAQYAAQAELARGRRAEACARGRAPDLGDTPPVFILRLRAYCAAVDGDRAAADLALEVAHGAAADDAWYRAAVSAAAGAPAARLPAARYDNSLATQLSIAAHLRPGANPLNNASTLALLALARNEQAPQPVRAQAAALAFRRGVLPVSEARTILLATPAEATTGVPAVVAALRTVQASPGSLDAATAIAGILRQAAAPGDFFAAARLFRDDIISLQTAPDAAAALVFARAALVLGNAEAAQRLIASARQAGANEAALAPLDAALIALAGARSDQGTVAMQRRIDAAGASMAARAARDVTILAALGAPVDGATQAFLVAHAPTGGARSDSGAMLALASAVERGALGEAALLAVIAAQPSPARLDAESIERIIRALRGVGLEADARRFAVEAILAGAPS
jgi:hypothetical protein